MRQPVHGRSWLSVIAIVGLLGLLWGGCATRTELPTAPLSLRSMERGTAAPAARSETKPPGQVEYCEQFVPFTAARFSHPRQIDNPWSPLVPGTQYVLQGEAGAGQIPHQVVFTVTDVIKEIGGIETVVLWDRDFDQGILAEAELAFFAQDDDGNIWSLGEYPEQYDVATGALLGAPSTWISGLHGAIPGTLMLADPRTGTGYYLQGRVPEIRFLDCAKVYKMGEKACVPTGCFDNVLVTDERGPLEQNSGHQRKYYATGTGNIRIDFVGDQQGEVLVQAERRQLGTAALRDARREVLRMDARGYQFSEVYSLTAPAR